jgi:hypothetical protein
LLLLNDFPEAYFKTRKATLVIFTTLFEVGDGDRNTLKYCLRHIGKTNLQLFFEGSISNVLFEILFCGEAF